MKKKIKMFLDILIYKHGTYMSYLAFPPNINIHKNIDCHLKT